MYDYLIVGAGLYGLVNARILTDAGKKCLVIEKRNHIGGNCYTEDVDGIKVHKYGPHIFHTDIPEVWEFINKYTTVNHFSCRPKLRYEDKIYSFPINLLTLHQVYGVLTPDEAKVWGIVGGNQIVAFDTDCGKIGILICYDVEFPELSRILADEGMDILFVPFLTDTQNGFSRVRHCAQARAIENECYVVMAGCVGNLPQVHNMDIQYAQSAVLTPSDFAFPSNAVKGEATPNTEMTLIVDIDLDLLRELHEYGSVRNMKDRRLELYEIKPPS